jgi:cell wall-associated NlpC family hydrolase
MTPFFSTPERLAALSASAEKWPGTPFVHWGAVPGKDGGASCHCLAAAVLAGAGFSVPEPMPRARVTRARQHTGGLMLPWLRARGTLFAEIAPIAISSVQPGDLLIANLGDLSEHHCGVALPGEQLIHTLRQKGAHLTALGDPQTARTLVGIFRPLEP